MDRLVSGEEPLADGEITAEVTADPTATLGVGTGLLLRVAQRRASATLAAALAQLGIEPRHFGVLLQLGQHQPLRQRQLIELLAADKSSMVRTIDELEDRAIVVRTPDPRDRRAHAIVLTPTGDQLRRQAERAAATASERIFAPLSPTEHHQLHQLLTKLIDRPEGVASLSAKR
jgi:MarR family transcriptional regulator, lower aerobic nicotinate degradation pathway regulator